MRTRGYNIIVLSACTETYNPSYAANGIVSFNMTRQPRKKLLEANFISTDSRKGKSRLTQCQLPSAQCDVEGLKPASVHNGHVRSHDVT